MACSFFISDIILCSSTCIVFRTWLAVEFYSALFLQSTIVVKCTKTSDVLYQSFLLYNNVQIAMIEVYLHPKVF